MQIITETIEVAEFNRIWISSAFFNFTGSGQLFLRFNPYDGNYLLTKVISKSIKDLSLEKEEDTELNVILENVETECRRQVGVEEEKLVSITINAPDPKHKVVAVIKFENNPNFIIKDCFKLAEEDPQFANVFQAMMGKLANISGFAYTT
jgi:hypothetical protein